MGGKFVRILFCRHMIPTGYEVSSWGFFSTDILPLRDMGGKFVRILFCRHMIPTGYEVSSWGFFSTDILSLRDKDARYLFSLRGINHTQIPRRGILSVEITSPSLLIYPVRGIILVEIYQTCPSPVKLAKVFCFFRRSYNL